MEAAGQVNSSMTSRTLLYLMHVDWRWIKQRPQFLAEHLAETNTVHVVHRLHPVRGAHWDTSIKSPPRLPLLPIPWSWRGLRWLTRPLHQHWVNFLSRGVRPDILWLTHPALLEVIPTRFSAVPMVYDCMDDSLA